MEKQKKIWKEIQGYCFMVIACLSYALSTDLFLAPNKIVAGGVSGLSVLINILYEKITIGVCIIVINAIILLVAFRMIGWKFVLKCLLTVAVLGGLTDVLEFLPSMTKDPILCSLYGGILLGIGIGLFVKYEFSSGGTELLGRLISRVVKVLKIPVCVGILDALIVIFGAIATKNPSNLLHALIVVFVSTKVSEMVIVGTEKSKLCIVITDKGEEISKTLLARSPRGVTMLEGRGMYTGKEHNVLFTCVKNRQLTQFREIVKSIDDHAFIIINDSVEVRGQGFQSLND